MKISSFGCFLFEKYICYSNFIAPGHSWLSRYWLGCTWFFSSFLSSSGLQALPLVQRFQVFIHRFFFFLLLDPPEKFPICNCSYFYALLPDIPLGWYVKTQVPDATFFFWMCLIIGTQCKPSHDKLIDLSWFNRWSNEKRH